MADKPAERHEEELNIDTGNIVNKKAGPKVSNPKAEPEAKIDKAGQLTATDLLNQLVDMTDDKFIPWEEYTLPSKGHYYGDKIPGGLVRLRGMGIHAEKILATPRLAQTGQSLDYLYKYCVELPNEVDPGDLLSGDRVFLLYALRGITHGPDYEFILKCPGCETSSSHSYNLNELSNTIKGPNLELGLEPFKVVLPYFSKTAGQEVWVKIRLIRGKDISQMANRQKFNKRIKSSVQQQHRSQDIVIDQTITENLNLIISSFGGNDATGEVTDHIKIRALVEKMHASDTSTIRQFLKDNSPGIDTTIDVQCPECGNEYQTEVPITESFFRPTSDRKTGRA